MLRALITLSISVAACGKLEAPPPPDAGADAGADVEAGTASCTTDKDCPGWEKGGAMCGYDMIGVCNAVKHCVQECTPLPPQSFCDCNGNTVISACPRSRTTQIASVGACDGGN
jgi:hypothetical protein